MRIYVDGVWVRLNNITLMKIFGEQQMIEVSVLVNIKFVDKTES